MSKTKDFHTQRLKTQIQHMEKSGFISDAELIGMFVGIRVILEANSLQRDYMVLNFYCNLIAHSTISGSPLGYDSLKNIMTALHREINNSDLSLLIENVTSSLNFNALISEMMRFFMLNNFPIMLLAPHNLKGVFDVLIRQLVGRQIAFPNNIQKLMSSDFKSLNKKNKSAVLAYTEVFSLGHDIRPDDPMILTKIIFNDCDNECVMDLHIGSKAILRVPMVNKF